MSIRLLLLEDNSGDARLIREMLGTRNDIEVVWVDRLSAGLDSIAQQPFDAVLPTRSWWTSMMGRSISKHRTVKARLSSCDCRSTSQRNRRRSHEANPLCG